MPIAFDGRLMVVIALAVAVGVLELAPIVIDGWLMVVIVCVGLMATVLVVESAPIACNGWCWNRCQSRAMGW